MNDHSFDADIVVIGAGTAGLNAFKEADRLGKSVRLVDHGPLGTMCARVGCMPSKAVLHAGHLAALMRAQCPDRAVDPALRRRLWADAVAYRDRMAGGAAESTRERAGDRLLCGTARFIDAHTIEVDGRRIRARAFVVAVGSSPKVPSSFAELGERVLTTDSLFELDELPASVGVVGAGAVGVEMGIALSRLGVAVTVADQEANPAGIVDPDIAACAIERFSGELDLWLGDAVDSGRDGDGVRMSSGSRSVVVERLLVAVGREPQLAALELSRAGITPDEHGQIDVDPATLRCGQGAIFVAGDASSGRPLLHEAIDEGTIAARQAVAAIDGQPLSRYQRRTPLSIVFTDPDIAAVGAPFDELDRDDIVVGSAKGSDNGRSILIDSEDSLLRLYARRGDGRLLGASIFGRGGEHLAHLLAFAVQRGETVATLLQLPYYHPTVEELVSSALRDAADKLDGVDPKGLVVEPTCR